MKSVGKPTTGATQSRGSSRTWKKIFVARQDRGDDAAAVTIVIIRRRRMARSGAGGLSRRGWAHTSERATAMEQEHAPLFLRVKFHPHTNAGPIALQGERTMSRLSRCAALALRSEERR